MTLSDEQIAALAKAFEIEGEGGELRSKVDASLRGLASDRRLLSTVEAAAVLGVPAGRLSRWARRGEIPSIRLSSSPSAWHYYEPAVIEELRRGGQAALASLTTDRKQLRNGKQRAAA